MDKYTVLVFRTGVTTTTVDVQASSGEAAKILAMKIASSKFARERFLIGASVEVVKPGVLTTQLLDLDKPTDNSDRAKRIDMIQILYGQIMGEEADESCRSATSLACILADMRHWCVEHEVDFSEALGISESHFAEEAEEVED
jgi:hypothetical protein